MSNVKLSKADKQRLGGLSWGMWAERAVVRALEIPPSTRVDGALLNGESASDVTLLIARAIGYLTGTQRAPELPEGVRVWLDNVSMSDGAARGARIGGLAWGNWAERACLTAMELDPEWQVGKGLLHGQPLWTVAITIARSVAFLAGTQRAPELPKVVRYWLQGAPRLLTASPVEEVAA